MRVEDRAPMSEAARAPQKWLYVFSAAHAVKVGVALDIYARRRSIETAAGTAISIEAAFACPVGRIYTVEAKAHRLLSEYATFGEWFRCSAEVAIEAVEMALLRNRQRVEHHRPRPSPQPTHPLVALADLGGRATPAELRARIGEAADGRRMRPLRRDRMVEDWTDVLVLTGRGWAEAIRLGAEVAA